MGSDNRKQQFIKVYEEYSDALYRYCFFKINDREMAKDLLQEAFLKTWTHIAKGEQILNMKAFIYKVLGNLVTDYYRKKRAVSLDAMIETGFDKGFSTTEQLENQIDGAKALETLKQIPELYREVIFMKYVQELSLKEIAEITEESENAVAVKIHRGLKKVKTIFDHTS
ncbi:MAG: RNA polymerase sigma factor [Patescibacteria group bacterium]